MVMESLHRFLRFESALSQSQGKAKCVFVFWPLQSIHRTCCLCEDTMRVFNPIFHHLSGLKGLAS